LSLPRLGRDEAHRRSAEAGFDHHLVKPIDLASLAALFDDSADAAPAS